MQQPLLEIQHLSLRYHGQELIDKLSFSVQPGEFVLVIGPGGSGKSSLLRVLMGMGGEAKSSGNIRWEGRSIERLSTQRRVALGLSFLPEIRPLFPELSVQEHLRIGGMYRRDRSMIKTEVQTVYDTFPILAERHSQAAGTLSGGEQAFLALAMVLMKAPKMILWDEASLGLSPVWIQKIFRIMPQLKQKGIALILTEQHRSLLPQNPDQLVYLGNA